ncbi:MAG: N-acetylmuramoyl-L-alanine amidase family protein, partial [Chloroflexota bacterium]
MALLGVAPVLAASPLTGKVIVVDAGHGGRDPGAIANGVWEKNVTLAIAQDLRAVLATQGARVVMTRTTDVALGPTTDADLQARVEAAQQAHANAFISIHANDTADPSVSGFTSFYGPQCGFYSGVTISPTDVGRAYAMGNNVEESVVARTGAINKGNHNM